MSSFLKTDGAEIFFFDWREGENTTLPMVLVNGFMRPSDDFRSIAKKLSQDGYRVISLDQRGTGKTRLERKPFLLEDMSADVIALCQHLDLQKIHLVGISMGGMIAQTVMEKASELVGAASFVSTSATPESLDIDTPWPREADAIRKRLERYLGPGYIETNRPLFEAFAKAMITNWQDATFQEHGAMQRGAVHAFAALEKPPSSAAIPIQIIHGSEDQIIPVEHAEGLRKRYPKANVHILDGKGHLLLVEARAELIEALASLSDS